MLAMIVILLLTSLLLSLQLWSAEKRIKQQEWEIEGLRAAIRSEELHDV